MKKGTLVKTNSNEEFSIRKTYIRLASAGVILTTLVSGCQTVPVTPEPEATVSNETPDSTVPPTPSPNPTPTSTPESTSPSSTPTSTPEIDLSAKGDYEKDPFSVDWRTVKIKTVEVSGVKKRFLYRLFADEKNKNITCYFDPFTDGKWGHDDKNGNFVADGFLASQGEVKELSFYDLELFLTQELGYTSEKATESLSPIKTFGDLRIWYKATISEDEQINFPLESNAPMSAKNADVIEQVKVLEKFWEDNHMFT